MTLHLTLPGSSQRSSHENQQELREARRMLKERVRTDWEYPNLAPWTSCGRRDGRTTAGKSEAAEDRVAGFKFHNSASAAQRSNANGDVLGLGFDPVDWRERQESSDDAGADGDEAGMTKLGSTEDSSYKFDDPESVGRQVADQREARKRKRCKASAEEMQWNDGLAHWTRRRDEWCCTRAATEVRLSGSLQSHPWAEEETQSDSNSASAGSSPRTSTSSTSAAHDSPPTSTPSTTPDVAVASSETKLSDLPMRPVLVPIAPPFLPDHPVRRRIAPSMYPEIYTKIILQSRTPSVPINLQTLVHALVRGWQEDGEWPPKMNPPEKSIGRRRAGGSGSLKEGVKAVGRVLRLTGVSEISRMHAG